MAHRFTERAVEALRDYIAANYESYLREVETELSLSSGALPNPVAYMQADLPSDNRNPRVDVYEESWEFRDDDRDRMYMVVNCTIAWIYKGDADNEAGEILARRCLTAMLKCLWDGRDLGGEVTAIYFLNGSAGAVTEENATQHVFAQGVAVVLDEEGL